MDKQPQSRAPLSIAIVLLLLLLYVGSYLVLVTPSGYTITTGYVGKIRWPKHYRVAESWCEKAFWPLEQLDRQVRPSAWTDHMQQIST